MNVLIIGANGFIGRRILTDLAKKQIYNITACSLHDDALPGEGYRFVCSDIREALEVERLFKESCPDVVINTSALSVPDYCETHPCEAHATNVTAVEHLARCCEQCGSRFIHLSTDFVFDGDRDQLYTEEDVPHPVNFYGITKLEGEARVTTYCSNYAIVRVVVVYGKALPGQHGNILQLVANRLRAQEAIRVATDQWRTPTFVGDISMAIERLLHHRHIGIYHIAGSDCLSIADIAYRVADQLHLDRSLICPISTDQMNESTPRPRFSGLSIAKAQREMDYYPHSLDKGIEEMFSE